MERFLSGAIAGLGATVPMTLAMIAMHRHLPAAAAHPLPPRRITMRGEESRRPKSVSTNDAHYALPFGYGAAWGAIRTVAPRDVSIDRRGHRIRTARVGGKLPRVAPSLGSHAGRQQPARAPERCGCIMPRKRRVSGRG